MPKLTEELAGPLRQMQVGNCLSWKHLFYPSDSNTIFLITVFLAPVVRSIANNNEKSKSIVLA